MLIHSLMDNSEANGPGKRAVIWFQGCSLGCPGCWNPQTHGFDFSKDTPLEKIMEWIAQLKDVEGVTFSGGEPMQQASSLYLLVYNIRKQRPDLTIGMFTGYSRKELESGKFRWKSMGNAEWVQGTPKLWQELSSHLDFAVMGRYNQTMKADEPLRSSLNQEIAFFTDRYKAEDIPPQSVEVDVDAEGVVQITGFPSEGFRKDFKNEGGEGELVPA